MDEKIKNRIDGLCTNFETYLDFLGDLKKNPFKPAQWDIHIKTIRMRKQLATVEEAIDSDEFLIQVHRTLASWGVNRNPGLVSRNDFKSRFRSAINRERLLSLEHKHVTQLDSATSDIQGVNIREMLLITMHGLRLSDSRKQVVPGAKALHHLLPSLLPPIDSLVGSFFAVGKTYSVEYPTTTYDILSGFADIGQTLQVLRGKNYLANLVDRRDSYSTSETKIIDNAIIGYVKKHRLRDKSTAV